MSRYLIFRSNDESAILDWENTRKPRAGKIVHKGGDRGNTREGDSGNKRANDNDRQKESKRTAVVWA